MTDLNKKLEAIILELSLNDLQEIILEMCWEGKSYGDIAAYCKYDKSYIRSVGANLWKKLSNKLGVNITKSNLRVVLTRYLQNQETILLPTSINPILAKEETPTFIDAIAYRVSQDSKLFRFPDGVIPLNSPYYISLLDREQIAYKQIENLGSILKIQAPYKIYALPISL